MSRVFADSGYWIALLNPRDDLHQKAKAVSRDLQPLQIITTEMVLTEFLNSFSDYGTSLRQAAVGAVVSLRIASQATIVAEKIRIIAQSSQIFAGALKLYEDVSDKSWSLTDCASFLIMREEGLTAALTHDRHFIQAGFQALLR